MKRRFDIIVFSSHSPGYTLEVYNLSISESANDSPRQPGHGSRTKEVGYMRQCICTYVHTSFWNPAPRAQSNESFGRGLEVRACGI